MSLFDRDSSCSSSGASASDGEDEGTLPVAAPPARQPQGNTTCTSAAAVPLTLLEQRRRMAEADAASVRRLGLCSAPWRSALMRRGPVFTSPTTRAVPQSTASTSEASKFGSAIAAAVNLRKEDKEKVLLKRLEQQRRVEEQKGDGKAFAQKDLEVGVFVTAAYRAVLQRNIYPSGRELSTPTDARGFAQAVDDAGESDQDKDDNDPLSAYLRELEGQKQVKTSASADVAVSSARGDYYDRIMKAPLEGERKKEKVFTEAELVSSICGETNAVYPSADTPVSPPTLSELQNLIGGHVLPAPATLLNSSTTPADFGACNVQGTAAPAPPTSFAALVQSSSPAVGYTEKEVHSAVLVHARLVYDTREARRGRTATDATVQACARRCDDRIASSLFCL